MAMMTTPTTTPTRADAAAYTFATDDALGLLPDGILDDLTLAIDAFEPLTPLEHVLGGWESVKTDPVLPIIETPAPLAPAAKEEGGSNPFQPAAPHERDTSGQSRAPMKNPSRERLRAELRYLRQRVVEMESELAAARQRQEQLATRKRPAVKWDQVAQDEQRKRQRAEEVNRQLCSALTKQTRVARSLEKVLQDHHGAEAFARFCDTDHSPFAAAEDDSSDEAIYARLEAEVAQAYSSVDRVLSECNMHDAQVLYTSSQTDVRTTTARNGTNAPQIVLEMVDSKFVPFDYPRTCDAFWRALSTAAVYQQHDMDTLEHAANTIRFKSRLPVKINGEQRKLRCLVVMKQYTVANRMVVVWRGMMATDDSSTRVPWVAAGWEETGWIVVREIENPHTVSGGDGTETERPCVVQTIWRQVPRWLSASAADPVTTEREIGAFSAMVLATAEDDFDHITSAMQNLLLAEVLDGVSAAAAVEP